MKGVTRQKKRFTMTFGLTQPLEKEIKPTLRDWFLMIKWVFFYTVNIKQDKASILIATPRQSPVLAKINRLISEGKPPQVVVAWQDLITVPVKNKPFSKR